MICYSIAAISSPIFAHNSANIGINRLGHIILLKYSEIVNENMNLDDPIVFLLKLFYFRLRNINLLFDYKYLQNIYKNLPSIKIQEEEFNSFKFYCFKK